MDAYMPHHAEVRGQAVGAGSFFLPHGPGNQVIRLGGNCFYTPSHLIVPRYFLFLLSLSFSLLSFSLSVSSKKVGG